MRARGRLRFLVLTTILVGLAALGLSLWWPPSDPTTRKSDLGGALVGGALVAGAVMTLEAAASARSETTQVRLMLAIERDAEGIHLDGRDLTEAYLVRRQFARASLRGADLRRAVLYRTVLSGADLSRADLRGADAGRLVLDGANLFRARLEGADLGYADLRGARLSGARGVASAKLTGAVYDEDTTWPDRFNPSAAGATHICTVTAVDAGPEGDQLPGRSVRRAD